MTLFRTTTVTSAILVATGLAGCGGSTEPVADTSPTPHGYVEGAEETADAQWRLSIVDQNGSTLELLDPATEEIAPLGTPASSTAIHTDGRHVFLPDGERTAIFDTGVWTVDHGDHVHYYQSEPREVGSVTVTGDPTVTGNAKVTVLSSPAGTTVLDRAALDDGQVTTLTELDAPLVVAFEDVLLATQSDGSLTTYDYNGNTVEDLDVECVDATAAAVTARGAVLLCATETVIVTNEDGQHTATTVAYPAEMTAPVGGLNHRPNTPVLATVTDSGQAVMFNVATHDWTILPTTSAVTATGSGEDSPILVLTGDGVLRSFEADSGAELAATELIDDLDSAAPALIQVDPARAYIADASASAVHEIDYRDDLRLARTIGLPSSPALMVETGW